MEPKELTREDFATVLPIQTRWMDNDAYGHVNNVHYYSYFDTAVNSLLVERGLLDIQHGAVVGLVVSSACSYFRPVAFPQKLEAGLRVARLGSSSVTYEIGIFQAGQPAVAALGTFVHVYVDRASQRPQPLPAPWRAVLEGLRLPQPPRPPVMRDP